MASAGSTFPAALIAEFFDPGLEKRKDRFKLFGISAPFARAVGVRPRRTWEALIERIFRVWATCAKSSKRSVHSIPRKAQTRRTSSSKSRTRYSCRQRWKEKEILSTNFAQGHRQIIEFRNCRKCEGFAARRIDGKMAGNSSAPTSRGSRKAKSIFAFGKKVAISGSLIVFIGSLSTKTFPLASTPKARTRCQ